MVLTEKPQAQKTADSHLHPAASVYFSVHHTANFLCVHMHVGRGIKKYEVGFQSFVSQNMFRICLTIYSSNIANVI